MTLTCATLIFSEHVSESLLVDPIIILNRQVITGALPLLTLQLSQANQLIFDPIRESQTVVHVTGLLELALALEADLVRDSLGAGSNFFLLGFGTLFNRLGLAEPAEEPALLLLRAFLVWKAGCVADSVLTVVLFAGFGELWLDTLHSVIIDENRCSSPLLLVVLNGGENTHHGWDNDPVES